MTSDAKEVEPASAERPSGPPDISIKSSAMDDPPDPLHLLDVRKYVVIKLEGVVLKALCLSDGAGKRLIPELWCSVSVDGSLQNGGEVEYEITFEADGADKTVSGKVKRSQRPEEPSES